jgi:hypothetical protein
VRRKWSTVSCSGREATLARSNFETVCFDGPALDDLPSIDRLKTVASRIRFF